MSVKIIPFFSEITPEDRVKSMIDQLSTSGAKIISPEDYEKDTDHSFFFVGSGGTERSIADFLTTNKLSGTISLLAHDTGNSLPAAMETRTFLQNNGIPARVMHAPFDELIERIKRWTFYIDILERIKNSRVGVVGKPSSWLIASDIDKNQVESVWGSTIEEYPLSGLIEKIDSELTEESKEVVKEFISSAKEVSVPEEDIVNAGHVTQAVLELVTANKLNAVTIQCFSLFEQTKITGCLALSRVNDIEQLVAGCEGDIPTTFTLMVAKLLTEDPAFMANVVEVDEQANTVVLAHCTSPTEILTEYDITTHFETGKSVAVKGVFDEQPVTLFKMFGKDLTDFWVSSGHIVENQYNECGCRTQVKIKLSEPVRYFLDDSLANHHVLLIGNYSDMISEFLSFKFSEF